MQYGILQRLSRMDRLFMLCRDGEKMETLLRERTAARGFKTGGTMNLMELEFICQVNANLKHGLLPGGKKLVYMNGVCTNLNNYLSCMRCPIHISSRPCAKLDYPNSIAHLDLLIRKIDPDWTRDIPS